MKLTLLVCSLLLLGLGCTQTVPQEAPREEPSSNDAATPSGSIEQGELFSLGDFVLTLPEGWTYKSFDRDGRTTVNTISVSHDPYETALVIRVKKSKETAVENPDSSLDLGNGVTQYRIASGGAWDAFTLEYNATLYDVTITVESDEPVAENLNGIWSPDPGVTRDQVDAMFKTIKPIR